MSKSVRAKLDTGTIKIEGYPPRIHTDLPDGHPFYVNVGLVASEWAHAEHALDLIIWKLAGIDPQYGACVTAQIMGIGVRCKAIVALATLKGLSPDLIKRVRSLMGKSYDVADLRARIVHDPWFIEAGESNVGQFKSMAYKDQRFGIMDVSQTEIDDTLRSIRKLKALAGDLHRDCLAALEASRKKQP